MEHVLLSEMTLPLPRARVFAFFAETGNLERITPPELGFTIVTPPDVAIHKDTRLEYTLRLFGVRFGWVSRISVWEPPTRFVDEQIRGPYKQWIHEHTFDESGDGSATIIRDRVRYRLPLEPFGDLAFPLVRLQLGRIFEYRGKAVLKALAP